MTAIEESPTLDSLASAVDAANEAVDSLDSASRDVALGLKAAIEDFHRPALVKIVKTLKEDPKGKELLFELVDDPDIRAVFTLHGIIKADPVTRANSVLLQIRPYLESHGGDVEVVRIADGTAYVRLHGNCNGCSMSSVTLQEGVAEALIGGLEEVDRLEVVEDTPTAAFIPVSAVGRRSPEEAGWVEGPAATDVVEGEIFRLDIDDDSFVIINADNRLAVFRNECVHQGMTLDGGLLDDGILTCPWHGFKFEASSGECISAPGAQLSQVPTRVEDGRVWIRVRNG